MKAFYIVFSFIIISASAGSQVVTLDYFIQQAKANSPLLKDYQNQVLANRLDSAMLRASTRTQVNFISSNSYAPVIKGWGYDEAITNIANIQGVVQANRNFVTKTNQAAQLLTIALQGRALADTFQLTVKDISRTIAEQYIIAYGDQATTAYNKEVYELLQKEEVILKKLTQQSVFKQTDYLNFYITLQQQELTYLQSQVQYNTDYLMLNYLAGIVDTTIKHIEPPMMNDTIQSNFFNSVFYTRYATDSLRLMNQRKLVNYEYKPKIGAYADAGYTSSLQVTPYKNLGFSVGLSLTVPIYDGHQKKMKLAKIDLQEKTRVANRDYNTNQYMQQVAMLKHQLASTDMMVSKIQAQISYANTLITANGKLIQTGDITMKDYVLAINNYLNAKNLLIQNNLSRLKLLNQLSYWTR